MDKGYKFTKIFFIIGVILGLLLFFKSSSLNNYGISLIIFTILASSIGWIIDKFRMKKWILPIILIIFYLIVFGFYFYNESHKINCLGCNFAPYENIFTGRCKTFCDICGHSAPWYYRKNLGCIDNISGFIGDMLRDNRDYRKQINKDIIYLN